MELRGTYDAGRGTAPAATNEPFGPTTAPWPIEKSEHTIEFTVCVDGQETGKGNSRKKTPAGVTTGFTGVIVPPERACTSAPGSRPFTATLEAEPISTAYCEARATWPCPKSCDTAED